jgi:DNA-directed RNA polymerase specialized sigma subunit
MVGSDGNIQEFQLASDYESSLDIVHEKEEKFKKIECAISSIENKSIKEVMFNRYVAGLSIKEIEIKLGIENNSTTRVHIKRGKKLISDMLTRL